MEHGSILAALAVVHPLVPNIALLTVSGTGKARVAIRSLMHAVFNFWETGQGVKSKAEAFLACKDQVGSAGQSVFKIFRALKTNFFFKIEVEPISAGRATEVTVFKSLPRIR